jgi:hypothetical protein
MLASGPSLVNYNNTTRSAIAIMKTLLEKPKVTLAIQRELVEDEKSLDQTGVGLFLAKDTHRKERQGVGTLNKRFDEICIVEIMAILEKMDHEHDKVKLKELVAGRDKLYKLQDELRDEMKHMRKDSDAERKLLREVWSVDDVEWDARIDTLKFEYAARDRSFTRRPDFERITACGVLTCVVVFGVCAIVLADRNRIRKP